MAVNTTGLKTQDAGRWEHPLVVHTSSPNAPGLSLRAHMLALGGFLLLTLLLTYPITLHFTSEIPFGGDAWQHIWNLWWVKHSLLDLHTNPYHTNLLFYPDGANLHFHTLALTASLVGIPLQLLGLNLLATYNILMMASFLLAGYGAFLLCHYLTRNVWASFVGGFVFAFAPYHFAHLIGHMNLASLQWIPFYVLLLLKALDAPGSRVRVLGKGEQGIWNSPTQNSKLKTQNFSSLPYSLTLPLGAGILLAINTYTDWLYGIFLGILTAMLLAWRLLLPSERRAFALRGIGWRDGTVRLAVGFAVYGLLVSPILFPTLQEAQKGYAQQPPLETLVYSSDATLAFVPSALHPLWGQFIKDRLQIGNPSERVVFLGYTVLALAIFAAWKLRKSAHVRFWAFAALATWILSLGPILQIFGKSRFTDFGVTIPLPYLILYKLPLLNIMRTPARLTVLTMLALAILVAFALAHTLPKSKIQNPKSAILIALPLLIAFEYLAVPFPMVPPGWSVPIYAKIASEPGQFAVLELPIRPFSDYMAYQTIHGKPLVGGYLSRQPPYPTLEKTPALKYLLNTTSFSDPLRSEVEGGKGIASLRELGVKYVIIRWWAFTDEERAGMQAKLDVLLGRDADFTYPGDQVDVWQISP